MPKKYNRNSIKPRSSHSSKRRPSLAQGSQLDFHQLEDRHLLAAITVTNATDLTNADTSSITALLASDGGDGISLREAITATNNTAGEDTITFDGGVFTGGANSLIRLTQGALEISETLTIDASAATDLTITGDANGDDVTVPGTFITDVAASFGGTLNAADDLLDDNSRVLRIFSGSSLTLLSSIVTGGRTTSDFSRGGGIYATGSDGDILSLIDSTVSGNSTYDQGADGGGISFRGSGLSLNNSIVSGNSTSGDGSSGGGIFSRADWVSLSNSTVSENSTIGYSSHGVGLNAFSGSIDLMNSTVSGNTATGPQSRGGGIYTRSGSLNLVDSIVNDNSTDGGGFASNGAGGGIYSREGLVSLTDSIVSGNSTNSRSYGGGGGISTDSGSVHLTGSTVSDNITYGYDSAGGGIFTYSGDISLVSSTVSGNSTTDTFSEGGGVASSSGDIAVVNSIVTGNSTSGDSSRGGGIASGIGEISLIASVVSDNSTSGRNSNGGGITNSLRTLILNSTSVNGNSTTGIDSVGGGIASDFVTLTNSTVSENTTSGRNSGGGGIASGFSVTLTNSTISGNSDTGTFSLGGGGILAGRDISLTNSTVSGNSSVADGGGIALRGFASRSFSSFNSIVAGNTAVETGPDVFVENDLFGDLLVEHSLIGDTTGSRVTATTGTGNILDQPALLGPLTDNGGPTFTHALLAGSPAIDAGSNASAVNSDGVPLSTDQRGGPFSRIFADTVDIGAFEVQPAPSPEIVSNTIDEGGALARPDLWNTLTVVFDSEVAISAEALSLFNDSIGGSPVDLSGIGFSFDSSTNTAAWDFGLLASPLDAAFYTYQLDANLITFEGVALDGNGDGTEGDDFVSQHYVAIPGDANLDGVVDVLNDAFALVGNLGSTTNLAWADGNFNGDEAVNVLGDAFILVGNLDRDVRPSVATGSSSLSASTGQTLPTAMAADSSAVSSNAFVSGSDLEDEDRLEEPQLQSIPTESTALVLVGSHDLRDDVFASEF